MYIGDLWLELWLKIHSKKYKILFHISAITLTAFKYQYKCNNNISVESVLTTNLSHASSLDVLKLLV